MTLMMPTAQERERQIERQTEREEGTKCISSSMHEHQGVSYFAANEQGQNWPRRHAASHGTDA